MCKTNLMKFILTILCSSSLLLCTKNTPAADNNNGQNNETEDIIVVDGKVKFYISDGSPRTFINGGKHRLTKVKVNNKEYTPVKEDDGRTSITVEASQSGEYNAVWINSLSKKWYNSSPYSEVRLPYSQFNKNTGEDLADFPMYSKYTTETGNKLIFKDAFAVLDLELTGTADITSVNVKSPEGEPVAGIVSFKPSSSSFVITKGISFAELNCTDGESGSMHIEEGTPAHFYLIMYPGKYSGGLQISICDASHKVMRFTTDPLTLEANKILKIQKTYTPDKNILYYEGFDTFVWGGDYVGGEKAPAFAPDENAVTPESSSDMTGYENAFVPTSYDNPGTGFIQSNTWDDCNSTVEKRKTVATSHRLSESWVRSRATGDFINMFRSQERPGYLEVGAGSPARGIVKTGRASSVSGIINAKYEFDICLRHDFNDNIEIYVEEGGIIRNCKINGKELDLGLEELAAKYIANSSWLIIPASYLTVPTSAEAAKCWDHIEITLDGATSGTAISISSESSDAGKHGFYIDNITLTRTSDIERGNLRVLSWNIQNGMWSDQGNNYKNFVNFVKKYDPDICIWCEAASIYKDGTNASAPEGERFLPDGWYALAARYGHKYVSIGGHRDNFPQVVTSKYPIETLLKITDTDQAKKPVSHGAGLHSINVNGRTIYITTLHTWPQSYAYGVPASDREASTAAHGGDYYREFEMNYVISKTKNNPEYSGNSDWIFAGDFNSRSRLDNWFYKYDESSTALITQDVILEKTDYIDVIENHYKGHFITSTQGRARIDYVYLTPSMNSCVKNVYTLMDEWLCGEKAGTTGFYNPSDHRPILVDFQF